MLASTHTDMLGRCAMLEVSCDLVSRSSSTNSRELERRFTGIDPTTVVGWLLCHATFQL
jgi:hypothetical protein